ncbi:MAG TPA: hydroxymethylbilane synthase [Solirubrobacteraceae bacterium]|nr:hydroxymethylbilane synthase [Solirubrobacteraceae bacterium]
MRIGTRASALALAQARELAELLGGAEIVPLSTRGDRGAVAQDKARWVAELEDALTAGEIDMAVHSAKDVPGELAEGLALLGAPARGAPEDVLCGAGGLGELQRGARVGTSSIRRMAQLRAAREDLDVVPVRGNVDTRLHKLADPDQGLHAIVLARAGLQRLGRASQAGGALDPAVFVPAPGQGTLALEGRADDPDARAAAAAVTDPSTLGCLLAERGLARELQASCHTPLGAHALTLDGGGLLLRAWVGLPDGTAWVSDELRGELREPAALAGEMAARMELAGAGELLRRAEEMAGVGSV